MLDIKYHQFHNNSYTDHYKIYLRDKDKKNMLEKYIFYFYTSFYT